MIRFNILRMFKFNILKMLKFNIIEMFKFLIKEYVLKMITVSIFFTVLEVLFTFA